MKEIKARIELIGFYGKTKIGETSESGREREKFIELSIWEIISYFKCTFRSKSAYLCSFFFRGLSALKIYVRFMIIRCYATFDFLWYKTEKSHFIISNGCSSESKYAENAEAECSKS